MNLRACSIVSALLLGGCALEHPTFGATTWSEDSAVLDRGVPDVLFARDAGRDALALDAGDGGRMDASRTDDVAADVILD